MLADGDAEAAFGCLLEREARRAGGSWEAQRTARIRGLRRKAARPASEPPHPVPKLRPVLLHGSFT